MRIFSQVKLKMCLKQNVHCQCTVNSVMNAMKFTQIKFCEVILVMCLLSADHNNLKLILKFQMNQLCKGLNITLIDPNLGNATHDVACGKCRDGYDSPTVSSTEPCRLIPHNCTGTKREGEFSFDPGQ